MIPDTKKREIVFLLLKEKYTLCVLVLMYFVSIFVEFLRGKLIVLGGNYNNLQQRQNITILH